MFHKIIRKTTALLLSCCLLSNTSTFQASQMQEVTQQQLPPEDIVGIYTARQFGKTCQNIKEPHISPDAIRLLAENPTFEQIAPKDLSAIQYYLKKEDTQLGRLIRYPENTRDLPFLKQRKRKVEATLAEISIHVKSFFTQQKQRYINLPSQTKILISILLGVVGSEALSRIAGFQQGTLGDKLVRGLSEPLINRCTQVMLKNNGDLYKTIQELKTKKNFLELVKCALQISIVHGISSTPLFSNQDSLHAPENPSFTSYLQTQLQQRTLNECVSYGLDIGEDQILYGRQKSWKKSAKDQLQIYRRTGNVVINSAASSLSYQVGQNRKNDLFQVEEMQERLWPEKGFQYFDNKKDNIEITHKASHFAIGGLSSVGHKLVNHFQDKQNLKQKLKNNELTQEEYDQIEKEIDKNISRDNLLTSAFAGGSGAVMGQLFIKDDIYNNIIPREENQSPEERLQLANQKIQESATYGKIRGIITGYLVGDVQSGYQGASNALENDFVFNERKYARELYEEDKYYEQLEKEEKAKKEWEEKSEERQAKAKSELDYEALADEYLANGKIGQSSEDSEGNTYYFFTTEDEEGNQYTHIYKTKAEACAALIDRDPKLRQEIDQTHKEHRYKYHEEQLKTLEEKEVITYFDKKIKQLQKQTRQAQQNKDQLKRKALALELATLQKLVKQKLSHNKYAKESQIKALDKIAYQLSCDIYYEYSLTDLQKSLEETLELANQLLKNDEDNQAAIQYTLKELQKIRSKALEIQRKLHPSKSSDIEDEEIYLECQRTAQEAYQKIKKLRIPLQIESTPPPPHTWQLLYHTGKGGVDNLVSTVTGLVKVSHRLSQMTLAHKFSVFLKEVSWNVYQKYQQNPDQDIRKIIFKEISTYPFFRKMVEEEKQLIEGIVEGVIQFYQYAKETLDPSEQTIYQRQAQKIIAQQDELVLHVENPNAWGFLQNEQRLKEAELCGYMVMEAIQWIYGAEIIEGIAHLGRTGKSYLFGEKLAKAKVTAQELAEMTHIANLPKNKQPQALSQLLAKNPNLHKEFIELEKNLAKNCAKGVQKVEKELLRKIEDGGKFPSKHANKLPKSWGGKLSKNKKGLKYINPKNSGDYIRFSPANLDPRAPIGQQVPYFTRVKDGNKYLTKEGIWVVYDLKKQESIHIPQDMFEELLPYMDFN